MNDPIAKESQSPEDAQTNSDQAMHPEMARTEFERFLKCCSIKPDKEDKEFADRVVGYIIEGLFVVNEEGEGTLKLTHPRAPVKSVTFGEPDGRILTKLDEMRNESYQKGLLAFIAAFAETTAAAMSKVKKRDFDRLKDIAMLFLG